MIGADAAIGFVIAAKTIARFRLLDDRDFAEYYLLGTLGSVSVAILTALVARAALGLTRRRRVPHRASGGGGEPSQPLRGGAERLEPLREREPQLRPAELRPREERRPGHGGDAGIVDEPPRERHVVLGRQVPAMSVIT